MSDSSNAGFGKFVPGFEFLQNLARGATQGIPQASNLGSWVAPTLDPQELEKRIGELKAVQFWLDQNATALKATIQALEVQKMTLATLKGMNLDLDGMARAFKFQAPAPVATPQAAAAPAEAAKTAAASSRAKPAQGAADAGAAAPAIDPVQLWGSLTQQFQHIAAGAMQDAARHTAAAQSAMNSVAGDAEKKSAATKKTVRKPASRSR